VARKRKVPKSAKIGEILVICSFSTRLSQSFVHNAMGQRKPQQKGLSTLQFTNCSIASQSMWDVSSLHGTDPYIGVGSQRAAGRTSLGFKTIPRYHLRLLRVCDGSDAAGYESSWPCRHDSILIAVTCVWLPHQSVSHPPSRCEADGSWKLESREKSSGFDLFISSHSHLSPN